MNYSKNMKVNRRLNRIIVSWLLILVIGIFIGLMIGRIGHVAEHQEEIETMKQLKEIQLFGIVDGKSDNWQMSRSWVSGAELGFIPLEVDMNEELQEFIYVLSYANNIDYAFVMGVMKTESEFNPNVISSTNDYGLMQINVVNHDWLKEELGITDFLDPYQNTISGLYILRNLFEKYEDPEKVLMVYNMGETGASKLWNKGIYETNYTNKVLENVRNFTNYIEERKVVND